MADIQQLVNKIVEDIEAPATGDIFDTPSVDLGTIDLSHSSKHEPSALLYSAPHVNTEWKSTNGWIDYGDTFPDNPKFKIPRGYQIEGINWLETRERTMLTDQPGLGKTLQAAMAATDHKPVLIICPTYLVKQWCTFLREQFPADKVVMAVGLRDKKDEALYDKSADWCVINSAMVRTHDIPVRFTRGTIIVDEFHHFRNRKSKQSMALAKLAHHNPNARVYGLTATPVWKEVDDLWMLFHIMQPDIFDNYNDFVNTFCIADEDQRYGIKVHGVKKSMIKELEKVLDIMRLGRSYSDAGRALPPIIENMVTIDMNPKTQELYDYARRGYLAAAEADSNFIMTSYMEVLHSLRKITANPQKMSAVCDSLEDSYLSVHPARRKPTVTFTWYKDSAKMLYAHILNDKRFSGLKVVCLTGEVKADLRPQLAMEADIVIASIPALSEGVNMYHMGTVNFFEEHWPPGSNYQALTRVRRDRNDDGQDQEPVVVNYFHCENSVDQYIHLVSQTRGKTIQEVLVECLQ